MEGRQCCCVGFWVVVYGALSARTVTALGGGGCPD